MRTTVDIPDATYGRLKARAALERKSVKQLLLQGAESVLSQPVKKKVRRLEAPILNSGEPGSLHIDNQQIYDLIGFP